MDSYYRRLEVKRREEILMRFMQAQIDAERHPMTNKEENRMSFPWDYYPELFAKDKKEYEEEKEQNEFEEFKFKRRQAMNNFNKGRRGNISEDDTQY